MLKLSPKTIREYGEEFADAGFLFTRAGTRKGGEIAWAVDKSNTVARMLQQSVGDSDAKHLMGISVKEAFSSEYDP